MEPQPDDKLLGRHLSALHPEDESLGRHLSTPHPHNDWQQNVSVPGPPLADGGFQSGLNHFILYDQSECRCSSLFFNEQHYLSANPDVAAAVAAHGFRSGLEHFVRYGRHESRVFLTTGQSAALDSLFGNHNWLTELLQG
ncbi:MAG: hypothetical protein HZA46_13085 [Planctomycetales bacterium]|nr:hypothetical protein [Planctomycetales bacterium]